MITFDRSVGYCKPTTTKLFAANFCTGHVYGQVVLKLNIGVRRDFTWTFLICDVSLHIIGADFLSNFGLLIDLKGKWLIDARTRLSSNCLEIKIAEPTEIKTFETENNVAHILKAFKNITILM